MADRTKCMTLYGPTGAPSRWTTDRRAILPAGPPAPASWSGSSGRSAASAPACPARPDTRSRSWTWRWPSGWRAAGGRRSAWGRSRSASGWATRRIWGCRSCSWSEFGSRLSGAPTRWSTNKQKHTNHEHVCGYRWSDRAHGSTRHTDALGVNICIHVQCCSKVCEPFAESVILKK